jgi:hypothetical protein
MDYKIEILETLNLIKVTTKFDTYGSKINKIEGVEEYNRLSRYKLTIKIGEMFTYEEVVKNIQKHLDARNDDPFLIDASRVKNETENETEDSLDRMIKTFKGELYGKEDKKSWYTVFKNLWRGENGKKVGVRWPL